MPVIVIGADTPTGEAIVGRLLTRGGEVRALVGDPAAAPALKDLGAKVAVGDISDGSLIELASHEAFTAVLVAEAVTDGRELSFAADPTELLNGWSEALRRSGVRRVIWVEAEGAADLHPALAGLSELSLVPAGLPKESAARRVADLDEAAH